MKKTVLTALLAGASALAVTLASCAQKTQAEPTLKDAFKDNFKMGVAVNAWQVSGADSIGHKIAADQFSSIVAENVMKCEVIHPRENEYFWDDADAFVKFGEDNGMFIVGHCLVWHSQCAPWFLVDEKGEYVDAETLKQRLRDHIYTIVGRYKGRVHAWDVVNEALEEDGSYRNSGFYQILGEEFIPLAFQYAHEADPDAELYYNDYNMWKAEKCAGAVKLVNGMKERGLRVDGIGIQGHWGMDYPELDDVDKSIEEFAKTGCKVMITEWDMSALPTVNQTANIADRVEFEKSMNPYPDGLPEEAAAAWNERTGQVFDLFRKHSDVIDRVTVWGVADGDSWRNDWPVRGRTEYPLLFDRNHEMKDFIKTRMNDKQS